jgi:pectate lyase
VILGASKLSVKFLSLLGIGRSCFFGGGKPSDMNATAPKSDPRTPRPKMIFGALRKSYAFESAGILMKLATIPILLRARGLAKILAAIIKRVVVYVIGLFAGAAIQDHAVHSDVIEALRLKAVKFLIVRSVPFKLTQPFKILGAYYRHLPLRKLNAAWLLLFALPVGAQSLPAFPGASGGGTLTIGGRNGTVMEITNLQDSGTGSFRACVTASGPRTCVCRVSGTIPVNSDITVGSPFLTILGQTCPGGGLIIGDGKIQGRELNIVTHDVVARFLTFNVNNPSIPVGPDTGTVGIEIGTRAYNVVLDHISTMFAGNKSIISYTSSTAQADAIHDVTVSWGLFTLPNVGHPVGCMTDTAAYAYLNINQDFHHNYFTQFGHRQCLYNTNKGHFVNNLTYNWCDPGAGYGFAMFPQGPSQQDIIGNIWKTGNMNKGCSNPHPVNINATGSDDCGTNCWNGATQPSDYMSGNVCDQGADWACAAQANSEGGPEVGPVPAAWRRQTPLAAEPNPIVADPVTGLDTKILKVVGNSQGVNCDGSLNTLHRNQIDAMVIASYPNGNGALFNQQYPAPTSAQAPACAEDPVSHVPNVYLTARGIPAGTSPWKVMPGDTYPLLETYANGQNVTPPPVTGWTGYLGSDALPGAAVGKQVVVGASAGPVRMSACTAAGGSAGPAMSPQPANYIGSTVTVMSGPSPVCSTGGVAFWQVQSGSAPPPHPTVSCSPTSVQTGATSQCTANQAITSWTASSGTITPAGLFTAPAQAGNVTITGSNANGSGSVPITVTSSAPVVTYPKISLAIVSNGVTTTLNCTANQQTGAYTCQ